MNGEGYDARLSYVSGFDGLDGTSAEKVDLNRWFLIANEQIMHYL